MFAMMLAIFAGSGLTVLVTGALTISRFPSLAMAPDYARLPGVLHLFPQSFTAATCPVSLFVAAAFAPGSTDAAPPRCEPPKPKDGTGATWNRTPAGA